MLDIISPGSWAASLSQLGLVVAPLTFSVQIFSLLVLLSLFVFVPVSIVGTLVRLAGLKTEAKDRGGVAKAVARRFGMYLLYHLGMFGIWFALAGYLIGGLYHDGPRYDYGAGKPAANQVDDTIAGQAERLPPDEMAPASPTDNGLRAPLPDDDRAIPEQGAPIGVSYTENLLSSNPYPPYDPIYTKSDILAATYFLILIYPLPFAGYAILWAVVAANAAYFFRKARGGKPFPPSPGLYIRLTTWNAAIFLAVAIGVRQLALF